VNAHLWEFPNVELAPGEPSIKLAARKVLGFTPIAFEPLCTIKHSITRYRISLEVVRVAGAKARFAGGKGEWLAPNQLRRLAFASAHKKILQKVL